ncbi:MAG: hypothetical protein GF311_01815 [Candidatus Lokiarchaeota archaeon]|nr:hypothetical protein [Candidatus Lokiarchaeota archaeon]
MNQIFLEPYLLVFFMALLLGFLHTILPCEDKAIFLFWSLGISKTPSRSLQILALYGLGLISSNLIIALITIFITSIPIFFGLIPDPNLINFIGAMSSIIAALVLLVFITQGKYKPHAKTPNGDFPNNLNWESPKTPYFFGILAGFAPCIFELIIYTQCAQYTISSGMIQGLLIVFFFSIGTFIGLFPLALAKYGGSHIIRRKKDKRRRIIYAMIIVIIIFNIIIIILSILDINVFPVDDLEVSINIIM